MFFSRAVLVSFLVASASLFSSNGSFDFRKHMLHTGKHVEGTELKISADLPVSFSHSDSRLGISSGNYMDIAAKLKSALHYRRDVHDWSTALYVSESYSMSPSIADRFVKSQDLLRFETRYLYNMLSWFAWFAHARLETSIFKSIDLNDSEQTFEVQNVDNSEREIIKGNEIKLADPFMPLFLQQNLGAAFGIVQETYLTLEGKGALSFRQTIADNQRVFVEETEDKRIIRDLRTYYHIGPLAGAAISGSFFDEKITYSAGIDSMWSFWQTPKPIHRGFIESLITEASAGIEFNLNSWSSLEYQYTAIRFPDILDKFQQNHALNLNISFDWAYVFGQQPEET